MNQTFSFLFFRDNAFKGSYYKRNKKMICLKYKETACRDCLFVSLVYAG